MQTRIYHIDGVADPTPKPDGGTDGLSDFRQRRGGGLFRVP